MQILIKPGPLQGELNAIPAKADAHRQLICAALSHTPTFISPAPVGNDIEATKNCLRQLGATIIEQNKGLLLKPQGLASDSLLLNCQESGATLRFLLPICAGLGKTATFCGNKRLATRPLKELISVLQEHGIVFEQSVALPFRIRGRLLGGKYCLPGHISSQYISGLLFALPMADQDSEIHLLSPLQAPGYVQMTLKTLACFGIKITQKEGNYSIPGRQKYHSPGKILLEGDWSNAAVFLAAGALAKTVCIKGLSTNSYQPDSAILPLLKAFGANVTQQNDLISVSRNKLYGQEIDIAATADLAPVLAVLGALAQGRTVLNNAARLRYKESDRFSSIYALLTSLGAIVRKNQDSLLIEGQNILQGGMIQNFADHRLVMAAALAACACRKEVTIDGAMAVKKSYPAFFEDYCSLGGNITCMESIAP
ncbi:MAG: 3-phosphoshikimate 1-carboxyvinyltransferase [Firmicutes bacterium]|nr:3-phosphoshikimate 1-carboxyvinyltransferase [Bacillota bacterium]